MPPLQIAPVVSLICFTANLIAIGLIMLAVAVMILPQRLKSPDFLVLLK